MHSNAAKTSPELETSPGYFLMRLYSVLMIPFVLDMPVYQDNLDWNFYNYIRKKKLEYGMCNFSYNYNDLNWSIVRGRRKHGGAIHY